jgi:malate dehydrogenase (oxaloacetate-decarboxylating)(NADP+)
MEGKANLFKRFADIDCFDIEIDADDVESVIAAVRAIAPTFGGINLEDIRAPDCFEIERRLEKELDIPVLHDDQHGTAIIAGAAILNAAEIRGTALTDMNVLFAGAGAAALACANMLVNLGVKNKNIWMYDVHGLVYEGREVDMFPEKSKFAQDSEQKGLAFADAFGGMDVFIGLSVGGIVKGEMLQRMNKMPVIFAMANPVPEITYEEAKKAVPEAIIATGRSDYPNQVNNVLGFPFIFRGALDCRARSFTFEMKRAAVQALADLAKEDVPDSVLAAYNTKRILFGPDYLIPKPFDPRVLLWVAPAVAKAAEESGVARAPIKDLNSYLQKLERLLEKTKEVIRPLMNRAKLAPQRIVFPEGDHEKILRAGQQLVDEGTCYPIVLGSKERISAVAESLNISLSGIEIIEPQKDERFASFAEKLWTQRRRKGMTRRAAYEFLKDRTAFGCMMVKEGFAEGLLGGVSIPYADTIRPALKVLGRDPSSKVISGVYAMLFEAKRVFFGDCTVNIVPDAHTLAQIAINTARIAETFGEEPRIAMLSYSDFGEQREDPRVRTVNEAIKLVRELAPDLQIDGEMQADTAINPILAKQDFPFSDIAGTANVLIFPDLASGNIAYKLLQELGNATAIGPIIVGFSHPVNALSLGCSVADIVNMSAITVNQVLDRKQS